MKQEWKHHVTKGNKLHVIPLKLMLLLDGIYLNVCAVLTASVFSIVFLIFAITIPQQAAAGAFLACSLLLIFIIPPFLRPL